MAKDIQWNLPASTEGQMCKNAQRNIALNRKKKKKRKTPKYPLIEK